MKRTALYGMRMPGRRPGATARRLGLAVVAAAVATMSQPLWAAAAIPSLPAAAHSAHFQLVTSATNVTFLGERQIPGGDFTAAWRLYSETVRVAGPSGSTVIVPKPAAKQALVTVRPLASAHKGSLAALAAAYALAGKSVVQDAMAVGYTRAEAMNLAAQAPAVDSVSLAYSPGQIIQTPCASVSGDGNNAYGRACDIQRMVQDNGGGNWIIADEVTSSGNDTGPFRWNTLESLTAYVNYGANNTIIKWTPNATITQGNCGTITLGFTYQGVGLSATQTVCPDRMDPYGTNTGNKFGASWSGCDTSNYTEGTTSVDVDNNPWNASDWPGLTVGISWGYCF